MIENRAAVLSSIVSPFVPEKTISHLRMRNHMGGKVTASYGKDGKGVDVRLAEAVTLHAGYTCYGASLEHFAMPKHLIAECKDKSTSLRLGFRVAGIADPGWHGRLKIEFYYAPPIEEIDGKLYMGPPSLALPAGWPCASMQFVPLAEDGDYGPDGKYQGEAALSIAR